MNDLVSVKVVAGWLGQSERWVQDKAFDGTLPAMKVGKSYKFDPEDIKAYLDECRKFRDEHFQAAQLRDNPNHNRDGMEFRGARYPGDSRA